MVASLAARGTRRGRDLIRLVGDEIRAARLAAGLSQSTVAAAAGISRSELSRIGRGVAQWLSVATAARLCAIVGLGLWLRAYPASDALRDAGHARLLSAFRRRLAPGVSIRAEVPVGPTGDLRAWDAVIADASGQVAIELEMRLVDAQALARRLALKRRDGSVDRIVIVLADTRANRAAYAAARLILESLCPLRPDEVTAALRSGRLPDRGGILFVRATTTRSESGRRRDARPASARGHPRTPRRRAELADEDPARGAAKP